jgi:hypothetical protein
MNIEKLDTVVKIAQFTKKVVHAYRQDKGEKTTIVKELAPLFASDAEGWKVVVDMGKFRSGFTRILGIGGMKALKELLYELDKKKYQKIKFGFEDD